MSIDSDTLQAFIDATDRQIEAIQKNTEALQEIKAEARIQTLSLQAQQVALEDMKKHFTNGFKAELLNRLAASEEAIDDKLSDLDKDMKVQWAIMGGGFLTVAVPIIIAVLQMSKGS
jgi:cell division GTPase FtsZ